MKKNIEIDKASPDSTVETPTTETQHVDVAQAKSQIKVWQFRRKRTVEPADFNDEKTGKKYVIKAHNWKVMLDPSKPDEKKAHEYLLRRIKSNDNNNEYWLLEGVSRSDKIPKRAETLKKLMEMGVAQLSGMLTPEEKLECGLLSNCDDRMQLVLAIVEKKKLAIGEETEER